MYSVESGRVFTQPRPTCDVMTFTNSLLSYCGIFVSDLATSSSANRGDISRVQIEIPP